MITTTYLALWACETIQDELNLSLLSFWVQIFLIESWHDMNHGDVLERKGKKKKIMYAKKGSFYTHACAQSSIWTLRLLSCAVKFLNLDSPAAGYTLVIYFGTAFLWTCVLCNTFLQDVAVSCDVRPCSLTESIVLPLDVTSRKREIFRKTDDLT